MKRVHYHRPGSKLVDGTKLGKGKGKRGSDLPRKGVSLHKGGSWIVGLELDLWVCGW